MPGSPLVLIKVYQSCPGSEKILSLMAKSILAFETIHTIPWKK